MKKTILFVAIIAAFAACSNPQPVNDAGTNKDAVANDTVGLSQFKQWKEQQQALSMDGVADKINTASINQELPVEKEKVAPVIIYRNVPARQPRRARTTIPTRNTEPPVAKVPEAPAGNNNGSAGKGTTTTETAGTGTSGTGTGTTTEPPIVKKNEGWSKAAKGTVIGAGSGAVLGAILSKDKGKGAIIGGRIGGAGGYVLGRSKDKKDGRY